MSTADRTSRPSDGSKRGYVPGAPTAPESRKRQRKAGRSARASPCPYLPTDVLDKILDIMVTNHDGLSVIKLGMVNRAFREGVNANLKIWYRLYLHWRGPVRSTGAKEIRTPRGVVYLRPTLPVSVPNFRVKTPPLT
jgi:hypothetical protein